MELKNLGGGRGLYGFSPFKTTAHGKVRIQDSSAAYGPCVWVFTELAYSNTPTVNPPHLHLSIKEAIKLRDRLSAWIESCK